jgi:hypothetical protein
MFLEHVFRSVFSYDRYGTVLNVTAFSILPASSVGQRIVWLIRNRLLMNSHKELQLPALNGLGEIYQLFHSVLTVEYN